MKLRVRSGRVTKTLTLPDAGDLTIGQVKDAIRRTLLTDLGLEASANFNLSLNGSSNLGSDAQRVNDVELVSGDLVKILVVEGDVSQSSAPTPSPIETNAPSSTPVTSGNSNQSAAATSSPSTHPATLLLHDYKYGQPLPPTLATLYNLPDVKSRFQVGCILLHNLMLESGFVSQTAEPSDLSRAFSSPVVCIEYTHPATAALVFMLTCNQLGPFILVNGIVRPCVNTEEQVISLQVKLVDHVTDFTTKPLDGKKIYKNVAKLSRVFKKDISHKALDCMRTELNLPPLHGILSLFPELLLRIGSFLDARSLCMIAQTCRTLSDVANDDLLWRPLYLQTFSTATVTSNDSWKEMYKREHLHRVRAERERREFERDFPMVPPVATVPDVPTSIPYPGPPFGILGGDYDLDPGFPYGPYGVGPRGRRPNPLAPTRPRMPGFGNPLPGSRFDPMHPFGGGHFRPGRGGGMMDYDDFMLPRRNRRGGPGSGGLGGGFI